MRLYIAILDEFPDYMTPTLVAHSMLGAHLQFIKGQTDINKLVDDGPYKHPNYIKWLQTSFKKCVVRVNQKEFDRIASLPNVYLGHENNTLGGKKACAIICPVPNDELPKVLKFAKLWKPKNAE